jgi:hypothetical protein
MLAGGGIGLDFGYYTTLHSGARWKSHSIGLPKIGPDIVDDFGK